MNTDYRNTIFANGQNTHCSANVCRQTHTTPALKAYCRTREHTKARPASKDSHRQAGTLTVHTLHTRKMSSLVAARAAQSRIKAARNKRASDTTAQRALEKKLVVRATISQHFRCEQTPVMCTCCRTLGRLSFCHGVRQQRSGTDRLVIVRRCRGNYSNTQTPLR
jgi:hypothetical protein